MGTAAAIFDLDRTLLAGGSGPIFERAMRKTGVIPDRENPVVSGLFDLFRTVGETYVTMQVTKAAARAAKGWSVEKVTEAAHLAIDELLGELQPHARQIIDEHRDAGRPVVIASTTPRHLIAPFAEALGLDGVVATEYAQADGLLTGEIDGEFVWNRGKLRAVERWAADNRIDLRTSYAYSDSFFDGPLLAAVGNPTAVNPDPRLWAMAKLKGWPIRHLDRPEGVSVAAGFELMDLVRPVLHPALVPNANFELAGLDHIPAEGPALVCANHRSYYDPFAIAVALARRGRTGRFLAKAELFESPLAPALRAVGTVRVDRGTGSEEPLDLAAEMLNGDEVVVILPQGTIPRGPAFFEPELEGRWGAARLAAQAGAEVPVIPLGLWGTEKVWPRSSKLPHLDLLSPPRVEMTAGPPIELGRSDPDADTAAIMAAISAVLPSEAREPYEPTEEELARTYPGGQAPSDVGGESQ